MSPRLKLSSHVVQRLTKLRPDVDYGYLFGLIYDGSLLIVGFSLEVDEERPQRAYADVQLNFPTDVEFCGAVRFRSDLAEAKVKNILQNVDVTDNPLLLTAQSDELKAHFLIHDRLEETQYEEISAEELAKQFVYVRLTATLPLFCEVNFNGVKEAIQTKRKNIAAGQASFHFPGSDVYLIGGESEATVSGMGGDPSIQDLMQSFEQNSKSKKRNVIDPIIIPASLVLKVSKDFLSDKLVKTAVKMMSTRGNPTYCIKLPLNIDILSMAHISTKLVPLYNVLLESTCRSLKLLEKNLLEQLTHEGVGDGAGLKMPDTFHFLPSNCGYFFTQILTRGIPHDSTDDHRDNLHKELAIPKTAPCFRRGNAYPFDKDNYNGLLINPHEAITAKVGMRADAQVAVVRGYYTYHHYMQDNFDDDGWGCAYRSLQTLCSWLRFQGYTEKPIPTHLQIQQCLVRIGDKLSSFVGSKQWIGSTEVSFCIESLMNVQSKILFVNAGSEMPSYANELLYHFKTVGSPVMIGGGVLAHTILGIEYCRESGDVRYLILDPHYTGKDDLATVVSKGWCSWKTSEFWNKTAHYNLCLPVAKQCI